VGTVWNNEQTPALVESAASPCPCPGRFGTPQEFPDQKGTLLQELDIVDGDWQMVITAPGGGGGVGPGPRVWAQGPGRGGMGGVQAASPPGGVRASE